MKYYITDYVKEKERQELLEKGLYCYDLRDSDFGNGIASIEKRVRVNNIGVIITNKELKFKEPPNDFIDYDSFVEANKIVDSIEDLLNNKNPIKNKNRNKGER